MTLNAYRWEQSIMLALINDSVHTKFEVPSSTHYKDMTAPII